MSNPSFENIDLWLFEWAEGNLSEKQIEQLELFLLKHPDLDVERDVWEMARVQGGPVDFPHVEELVRKRDFGFFAYATASAVSVVLLLLGMFIAPVTSDLTTSQLSEVYTASNQKQENSSARSGNSNNLNSSTSELVSEDGNLTSYERIVQSVLDGNQNAMTSGNIWQNEISSTSPIGSQYTSSNNLLSINFAAPQVNDITQINTLKLTPEMELKSASDKIKVRKARTIDLNFGETRSTYRNYNSSGGGIAYNNTYKTSLKTQMNRFARSVQRMMDNPIALKNARDPQFLVPGMTVNDINFSSAGTMMATRVQTLSRVQWSGQDNEQLMNELSLDGYSYGIRGGWGVQFNHNYYKNGMIQVSQAAFTYSPKISVNQRLSIEPSLRFKMGNKYLNSQVVSDATSQVEIDRGNAMDFYQSGAQPIGKSLWYKDMGVGLLVNTKWFYVGAQTDNLFRYTDNIYDFDINDPHRASGTFVATIGTDWLSKRKHLELSPYLVYQNNAQLSELWGGFNTRWHWVTIGVAGSQKMDVAASLGIKFKHFSCSYSADYTNSMMTGQRSMSHQLNLRIVTKQGRAGQRLQN